MSKLKKNKFRRKLIKIICSMLLEARDTEKIGIIGLADGNYIENKLLDQICELIDKEVVEEDEEEVSGCNCGYCKRRENDVYIRNQLRFEQREVIGREGR